MKTFITSDLHFGHQNIMKFCPATRAKFHNVDHMNEEMIRMWNETVTEDDLVYILGDVSFTDLFRTVQILNRLHGKKILIEGNHDRRLLKQDKFRQCFAEIHTYLRLSYNNHLLILFHFPIAEYDQQHRGSIHLHGHLHGNPSGLENFRVRDVGFDATGKIVILLDDAITDALKGEIKKGHQKEVIL